MATATTLPKTITLGGDLTVNRMGFGAMRITGEGIWGDPADKAEAVKLLLRVKDLGVDFIDTADAYGPDVSEDLIRAALHPYDDMIIATKGGNTRQGPNKWAVVGRPEYLRQAVLMSMRRLEVGQIDLWQLHRIDPEVPQDEQFGVIADMQKEGLIKHVGLSEVSVDEIKAAQKHFDVVSVQNLYNLVTRQSEDVLDYCEEQGIAFIPWFPLAAGQLADDGNSVLANVVERTGSSPSQVALAWVLQRSPVMLPIPGTSSIQHLEENVAAADIVLSDEDFESLDKAGKQAWEESKES